MSSSNKFEHVHHRKRTIFVHNFIGGVAWGLGATAGLTTVLAILGAILQWIDLVPVVGDFVARVIEFVENK